MTGPDRRRAGSTTEQLRDDIDSGRTASKVAARDPAAEPLGTDAEAAGTPPHASEIVSARRDERRAGATATAAARDPAVRRSRRATWLLALGGLVIVLVAVGMALPA